MVSSALKLAPLAKRNMDQLRANAERLGVLPEEFAKAVVEDYLELQREAASSDFAEIMGPVRKSAGKVSEAEVISLVKRARADRRRRATRRTRR